LEASNLTESYLLYSGEKKATLEGEKIIKDAVDAATPPPVVKAFTVRTSGVATRTAESSDFEVTLPQSAVQQVITLTGIVSGENLSANPGLTTWIKVYGPDGWLETAGDSTTVDVVIPSNTFGSIAINARPKDDTGRSVNITIRVLDWHTALNHDGDNAEIVDARAYILPKAKTGDTAEWMAIARQVVSGQEYYLIVRREVPPDYTPFGAAEIPSTMTNNYRDSWLRMKTEIWWNSINDGSILKTYAAYNNALDMVGTDYKHATPFAGFSSPAAGGEYSSPFALSVDEVAEYLSRSWYDDSGSRLYNTSDGTESGTPLTAYTNWETLTDAEYSWLRTPTTDSFYPISAAQLDNSGGIYRCAIGSADCFRPALWVRAEIFAAGS
jgi:hypothetical protein